MTDRVGDELADDDLGLVDDGVGTSRAGRSSTSSLRIRGAAEGAHGMRIVLFSLSGAPAALLTLAGPSSYVGRHPDFLLGGALHRLAGHADWPRPSSRR